MKFGSTNVIPSLETILKFFWKVSPAAGLLLFLSAAMLPAAEVSVSTEVVDLGDIAVNYGQAELPTLRIGKIDFQKQVEETSTGGMKDFLLVDVSPLAEFNLKHMDGAISVPIPDIEKNTDRLKEMERQKEYVKSGLWIRVYSHDSIDEAREAAKKIALVGLKHVYYLGFTLTDWQKAGYPIVSRVPILEKADTARKSKEPGESIIPVDKDKPPIINSLEIDPGEIPVLSHIPLGKTVKVSELINAKIRIKNYDSRNHKYDVGIFTSKDVGAKLKSGYEDIPDVTWIQPEFREIEVSGNSAREMEIYIKVPDKTKLLNKKFQAVIEIKSQKERPEDIFIIAAQALITFKTDIYEDKLTFTLINDPDITTGADYSSELKFLKFLPSQYSNMQIDKVDYSSSQGKQLIKQYDISFLPAYLFNPKIEQVKEFEQFVKDGYLIKLKDGNYIYSSVDRPGIFINRPRIPKTLEIFISPGQQNDNGFVKEIVAGRKTGKIPRDVNLIFTSMPPQDLSVTANTTAGSGTYGISPAGMMMMEEGMRLAYLQKNHKDKFYDYLQLREENITSALWEESAQRAGLNPEEIKRALMSGEARKILDEGYSKVKELKFNTASTVTYLLYENRVLLSDPKLLNFFADFKTAQIKSTKPCCGGSSNAGGSGVITPTPTTPSTPSVPTLQGTVLPTPGAAPIATPAQNLNSK